MSRFLSVLFVLLCSSLVSPAQTDSSETDTAFAAEMQKIVDRDKQIKYQTGAVDVNAEVKLTVPAGYKFMSKSDAEYVIFDFWGNPRRDDIMGMVVKQDYSIVDPAAWAFIVSYESSGFVKDEDAADIDYDEMMDELKESESAENDERQKQGYGPIHMIGWAAKPFYDKKNNILHWAKSMQFGDAPDTTLNYDVRILGRRGILSLNAVGTIDQIGDIKQHIPDIIHIAKFKDGSRYIDFDPEVDQVAAYTIGGLVAGKLLAKAGILALVLKNIKLVLLGIAVFFGAIRKKVAGLFGKKEPQPETDTAGLDTNETEPTSES
jgi:uncharacterized membrane-anchored protein